MSPLAAPFLGGFAMPSKPTATLINKPVVSEEDTIIAGLRQEQRRYPYSPVFGQAIALVEKHKKAAPPEQQVQVTMPKETSEKLYGLLGQITKHSGFDDLFESLENANFVLRRQRPKMHFVRDNVITADF